MEPQERRLQIRAYHEWLRVADGKPWPSLADMENVSSEALGHPDWRDKSFLMHVADVEAEPDFVFIGKDLLADCEGCGPVQLLSDVPSMSLLSRLADNFLQCVANAAPVGFEATFVNRVQKEIHYRGIILPLSSDGMQIDHVWGAVSFKIEETVQPPVEVTVLKPKVPRLDSTDHDGPVLDMLLADVLEDEAIAEADLKVEVAAPAADVSAPERDPALVSACRAKLADCMRISGTVSASVVDCVTGASLVSTSHFAVEDIEQITAAATDVLNQRQAAFVKAGLSERIEDVLFTLEEYYLLLRPLTSEAGEGVALMLVMDNKKSNFGMARFKLAEIEKSLAS